MSNRPNLLFVVCDDLNDAVSGMGGHPQAQTPNIDRLMRQGVRFTNGASNSPICGPSRASFLSGLAPWTTGYYGYNCGRNPWWNNPTLGRSRTLMEHFGANGYEVFGTGKIFHNHQEKQEVWKSGHGHMVDWGPWSWDGQKPGAGWDACVSHPSLPHDWNAEMLFASLADIPDIPPDPNTGSPGYRGWRHGDNRPFRYVSETDRDLMHDEKNAAYAAEILACRHEDPFLLCVGIGRPHSPLIAPQTFFDQFPLENIQLAVTKEGDLDDCAQIFKDGHTSTGAWGFQKYKAILDAGGIELLRKWTQAYLACIAYADAQIGTILDALEASPYHANTYVVLVSDNGYHMGEKEYLFKNSCWEESARIPFVISGPCVRPNRACTTPVSLLDLFPTFNDLCGLPMDVNAQTNGQPLDGHILTPLLQDPEAGVWDGPEASITVVASDTPPDISTPGRVNDQHWSVRTQTHRYILYKNGEEELYDHVSDPCEWINLAHDPTHEMVKRKHRNTLRKITGYENMPPAA